MRPTDPTLHIRRTPLTVPGAGLTQLPAEPTKRQAVLIQPPNPSIPHHKHRTQIALLLAALTTLAVLPEAVTL